MRPASQRSNPLTQEHGVFLLIPVLNEAANIGPLLDQIEVQLAGVPFTIGILDDGSTDGTLEYLEQRMKRVPAHLHLIRRQKTRRASQRGSALRALMLWGLEHTRHGVFVEMDGDLSHRPEELPDGIRLITEWQCDVAIASKYIPGSAVVHRPWSRRMVSRVCSWAVRLLISRKVRDYSNGYRFYTRSAAQLAAGHAYRYGSPIYLSEILALWMRCGLRIIEFKSLYVGRNEGLSKLRAADLVKAAIAVFEISARYHVLGFRRQSGSKEYGSTAAAAVESSSHIRTRSKANDAASQE
jgi:dolichol-phosphate mannosyltransferase